MIADTITLTKLTSIAIGMTTLADEVADIQEQALTGDITTETAAVHLKEIKDRLNELFQ